MNSRKLAIEKIVKYVLLSLYVFVLYILQGIPGFLSVFGIKPVLLIPFCINLAMLEDEQYTIIVYVIAGMLFELSAGRVIGFYTIPIIIACTICSIVVKFFFKANYRNTIALSFISTFVILLIDFFFGYMLSGYKGLLAIFIKGVLLSSAYSVVFSIIHYKIIQAIQNKFKRFNAR